MNEVILLKNNNRHLIALDLDGTLLTSKKEISDTTKKVLIQAIDEGHIVVIATGRSHRTSSLYYDTLRLSTPIINNNGAFIHHPKDKSFGSYHQPLPHQTALAVVDACYELDVENIIAQMFDSVLIDRHNDSILNVFNSAGDPSLKIGKLKNILETDPTALLIHPKQEQVKKLNDHLNDYHAEVISHRTWAAPWNIIEIVKKGLSKAVGLEKVSNYYNIPRENIIAFGDEDNDLEMIEYAGVGVAMENGIKQLKSVANHVTNTNDQDGIGVFLKDYLKI